jgi:dynactin complex subunit
MTLTVPEVLGILALVLATAKFLASRLDSIKVDNTAAHAAITDNVKAITENVKESRRQTAAAHAALSENVQENQRQIASLGAKVDAIAVDVAFLRGRQEQRDRADREAGG